ncbi:hypothetical protein GGR57DRAFT_520009 [Xylariaceae sp. FL1272]|nr:hypothetical protein GGR57DRAFT_520009 [Xylariaceae sp. FL1272]
MSSNSVSPQMDANAAKRRKIRKGTTSCWECKRRKTRCTFRAPGDVVCVGCNQRGSKCLGQDLDNGNAHEDGGTLQMSDRMGRVEAIVQDLVERHGSQRHGVAGSCLAIPTPDSCHTTNDPCDSTTKPPSTNPVANARAEARLSPHASPSSLPIGILPSQISNSYEQLSSTLFSALPSQNDIRLIWRASSPVSVQLIQHLRMSPEKSHKLDVNDAKQKLFNCPAADTHPIIIARFMLILATFLQYLNPQIFDRLKDLSEPPRVMMRRLADIAISHATAHEELLGSVEALECVIIEATFQANIGNLRRAWLAFRRAVNMAQLMGFHRKVSNQRLEMLDPSTEMVDTQIIWFRITYIDRFLSLMLGLPPASSDYGIASDSALANETPLGRLARIHCSLATKILERNKVSPSGDDFDITQDIDSQLQRAANSLPGKWWSIPNLVVAPEDDLYLETVRLMEQLYHYDLLNQLYVPYMLPFSSGAMTVEEHSRYLHAKHTCIYASREVLNRFIMFRSFNRVAFCCRSIDFFGLMSAMTLLLAHLDSHQTDRRSESTPNMLSHQRPSDRAMMEQVLESMEDVSLLNADIMTHKSAALMRQLLDIEAEAANGKTFTAERLSASDVDLDKAGAHEMLCIPIPYFGLVRITDECMVSGGQPVAQAQHVLQDPQIQIAPAPNSVKDSASGPNTLLPDFELSTSRGPHFETQQDNRRLRQDALPHTGQFPALSDHTTRQHYSLPTLTAGDEDFLFQGVDLAFFDNLIRGSEMEMIGDGVVSGAIPAMEGRFSTQ